MMLVTILLITEPYSSTVTSNMLNAILKKLKYLLPKRKVQWLNFELAGDKGDSRVDWLQGCGRLAQLVKVHASGRNKSQHYCVLLANNVASVCMGLKVWPVSNYPQQVPTSANIVVVPCKRTQHVRPNNVACCWPTMLRPFAWAFRSLTANQEVPGSIPGLVEFWTLGDLLSPHRPWTGTLNCWSGIPTYYRVI